MSGRIIFVIILGVFLLPASEAFSIDKQTEEPAYKPGEIIVKFRQGAAETLEKQLSKGDTRGALKVSTSLDELSRRHKVKKIRPLVKGFKAKRQQTMELLNKGEAGLTKREKHLFRRLKRAPKGVKVPELDRIYKIELEEGQSAEEAVAEYNQNPDVEYAELNYIVHTATSPNDPYYNVQWALNNTGQSYPVSGGGSNSGTADADIDAPEAWDLYTGGLETIVAVIDTGVDYTHGDLIGNMWTDVNGHCGYDFVDYDNDPMDDNGHGTHCSGIINARANNGLDVTGACWDVKIMAVRCLDASGSGYISDIVNGFHYAMDNGADVLSNSWGGPYITSLRETINYAYSQGVIMVAAAGNNNSSSHFYPANYDHVISVAATDSNDDKASFSNYGEWIDLAAPGVDILSLRAEDTDMYLGSSGYSPGDRFVPFGDPEATMYIASGTSMACPYVSGACALMLSVDPFLTTEEVNDILADTADPIADGICYSDGRLNLFGALVGAIQSASKGFITLDSDYYSCDSNIVISLNDCDLAGEGTHNINVTATSGDSETVILTEESPSIGAFKGTIHTAAGGPNIEDGSLQVTHDDIVCATYYDANDGTGNPAIVTDTGTIDCAPPVISNIQMDVKGDKLTVTFDSDEPTTGTVSCGPVCGGPYNFEGNSPSFQTSHTIEVQLTLPYTTCYFVVTAIDIVDNQTTDSNSGNCYSFITTGPCDMYVPSEYATIQEAIDYSWPGSVVLVADGVYTGEGNRDIDFLGKAITVKSRNGPENCIIDCQSTGRGFYFHSSEDVNSVADGFTITGAAGRGIQCTGASPTIENCIINNNGGGIGCYDDSYPHISNCIISDNNAFWGGGIACDLSDPVISNCVLANNTNHGGLYCSNSSPIVRNCLFYGNVSTEYGGGVRCSGGLGAGSRPSNPYFSSCTFAGNSTEYDGGGIYLYRRCNVTVTNCIFWGNKAGRNGHEICLGAVSPHNTMTVSYCDIQSADGGIYVGGGATLDWGIGNIEADPCFVTGPESDYYLSQIAAGQTVDSPCVDAGGDWAMNLKMNLYTTRTDTYPDQGIVDMGYHSFFNRPVDVYKDWFVDFFDFAILADDWFKCNDPCGSGCIEAELLEGDIILDYYVDIYDLAILTDSWLGCYVTNAWASEPADNEAGVDPNVVLKWSAGDGAILHDVYFGTDANSVADANYFSEEYMGTVSDVNFDPCSLDMYTTYFWRVDELGPKCMKKGDVWSFTTWAPEAGVVGWWKFDEANGTTAYDSAGDNDGDVYGATWTNGQIGGALNFDGNDDWVDLGTDIFFEATLESSGATISAWVYPTSTLDFADVVVGIEERFNIQKSPYLDLENYWSVLIFDGDSKVVVSTSEIETGKWVFLAATWDTTTLKFYVDGVFQGSVIQGTPLIDPVHRPITVGASYSDILHYTIPAVIDDVRIYDRALSEGEVEQLYESGL